MFGIGVGITDICVLQTAWLNQVTPTPTPGPTPNPGAGTTLSVPGLTRTSPVLMTPPVLVGDFDITYQPNDWAHLEMADDYAFTTHVGNFYAQLPAVGNPTFALGGYVPAAAGFARLRGLKAGSPTQSISAEDWTAYATPVAWGDNVAPTITSTSTDTNAENSVLAHALTANEPIATWSLVGGADIAQFEISGSTLRWASNGTKDFESPNDANTDNAYVAIVRAADYAGNTTDQTITMTVTDVAEVIPTTWSTTNKSPAGALSGGNLIWSYDDAGGDGPVGIATNTSKSSGKWEIKLVPNFMGATGYTPGISVGLCLASQSFTASFCAKPGQDNSNGVAITLSPSGDMNIRQGGSYVGDVGGGAIATSDDFRMLIDLGAKLVWFKRNGTVASGDPVAGTGGFDVSTWLTGAIRVWAAPEAARAVTITPTPTSLTSGFLAWD